MANPAPPYLKEAPRLGYNVVQRSTEPICPKYLERDASRVAWVC